MVTRSGGGSIEGSPADASTLKEPLIVALRGHPPRGGLRAARRVRIGWHEQRARRHGGRRRAGGTRGPARGAGGGGGGGSAQVYAATGRYTLRGGTITRTDASIVAGGTDESGVLVTDSGVLALRSSSVTTTGDSRSSDASSFYGLNAGVLANGGAKVAISGSSVITSGEGANGIYAYGAGASVSMTGGSIRSGGGGAHGAMTAGGGAVTVDGVHISTAGASAAALATDRGGGTVRVGGGTMTTSGYKSPDIYSTGVIVVAGAKMSATDAEAAVVEGGNSVEVADTALTAARQHGVMLYNSMSGDANAGTGVFTMSGGSLAAAEGPAFYVTNTRAAITVEQGARVSASSGVLAKADSNGTGSGNTGAGIATITLDGETLAGDLLTGGKGTIAASLRNRTALAGTIDAAALTLDATSTWKLTGNSTLTTLSDPGGIRGSSVANIVGDGHTATYDASLPGNSELAGKAYELADGGMLRPA